MIFLSVIFNFTSFFRNVFIVFFFSVFIFFLHLLPFPLSKRTKHEGIKKTFFIHFPFFHTSDFLLNVTCSLLNFFIFIYSCSNSRRLDFFLSVMTCKKQQEKKNKLTSTRHIPNSTLIDDKLIRTRNELIAMHAFFFAREKIKRSKPFYFLLLRKKVTVISHYYPILFNQKKSILRNCSTAHAHKCVCILFCLY